MPFELYVVDCDEMGCTECKREKLGECSMLDDAALAPYTKVLLVERRKRMLHLYDLDKETAKVDGSYGVCNSVYFGKGIQIPENVNQIIGAYLVGSYLSLFYNDPLVGTMFIAIPKLRTELEAELLEDLLVKNELLHDNKRLLRGKLTERIHSIQNRTYLYLKEVLPELADDTAVVMSNIIGYRNSVLEKIMPILLDDDVEEVYLDFPGDNVYFDHSCFGRVQSKVVLSPEDTNKLVTLLRSESNLHLDRRNPSLKTSFPLFDAMLRVSVSCPPLSPDGLHMEIRKAKRTPLSVIDLIENGTMSVEVASLLVLAVNMRMNITITGSPSSGKTTLLNALDAITPENWRKIYIEDAIESRRIDGRHQVRIQVDPLDEVQSELEKSVEIMKSLHRSPDYLILGEIQTAEHSDALFQAISAGLRSVQTCHSDSSAGLVTRWVQNHGVSKANIAMMDLIVTLRKPTPGKSLRQVSEVAEVLRTTKEGILSFNGLHVLFDNCESRETSPWSPEGSFVWRAREEGATDLQGVYRLVVKHLNDCMKRKKPMGSSYVSVNLHLGNSL